MSISADRLYAALRSGERCGSCRHRIIAARGDQRSRAHVTVRDCKLRETPWRLSECPGATR